jgi:APA family basic amino acid/polyamine antiporter
LATVLTPNLALATLINLGLLVWGPIIIGSNMLALTRIVLGVAFDRVIPTQLADVSDRYHTPVKSIVFVGVIIWLGLIASLYYGVVFANVNYTLEACIIFAIVGLAGAVFPFLRKSLYDRTPIARYTLGGVPLVTISGSITFLFFVYLAYSAGLNPAVGGPTNPYALLIGVVFLIGCALVYYVSRAYHKTRTGIDISLAFREIPPE